MPATEPNANEPEAPKAAAPKSKRRWLRFSLRSLLVLMLLFAVFFAWVAKRMREKRLERAAAAEMIHHGAFSANLKPDHSDRTTRSPFLTWLEHWLGEGFFDDNTVLAVDGPMTDGGFKLVANCRYLKELWVNNAELTADGLIALKDLHGLEFIDLDNNNNSATDLEFLDGMPSLTYLELAWFYPTEAGWRRIRSLPNLHVHVRFQP